MEKIKAELRAAIDEAKKARQDLEKKTLHMNTLFETSRELAGIIQPQKIMETFLLMAMGPLGVDHGLVALINSMTFEAHLACRGLAEDQAARLRGLGAQMIGRYFSAGVQAREAALPRAVILSRDPGADHSLLPPGAEVLVLWTVDQTYCGLLGLGAKISGQAFDSQDLEVLLNLTNTLVGALRHTLASNSICQLNADLTQKNAQLKESLSLCRQSQHSLDRRVHQLKSLNQLAAELGPIHNTKTMLERFLLMLLGTYSVDKGLIVLVDRRDKAVHMAHRGLEWSGRMSFQAADMLLYNCFDLSEARSLAPLSASLVQNAKMTLQKSGVPMDVSKAVFLAISQHKLGFLALGPKFTGEVFDQDEEHLLLSQTASLMAFLENAAAFETIESLNKALRVRNVELEQTIDQLTEARRHVAVAERAKERFKSLIAGQSKRVDRVSAFDLAVIFLASLVLGLLFNTASPSGIDLWPRDMGQAGLTLVEPEAANRMASTAHAVVVDARPAEFYRQRHVRDAVNVPPALFDIVYMMKLSQLDPATPLVVYGRTFSRRYDQEVAHRLRVRDHAKVSILRGGLAAWENQGYPVAP
ncbi:MAG: rhodanese-like domain-containing protein [Desulfovibrionaceae bacterium]|nr:rhodanese-like domain-containing protein [Desulfovibrionaceae bacterium]